MVLPSPLHTVLALHQLALILISPLLKLPKMLMSLTLHTI